jgi:hypothetical protein
MRRLSPRFLPLLPAVLAVQLFAALSCRTHAAPAPRVAAPPRVPSPAAAPPAARLGINLSGPADWNTELPFVDVFRLSRTWISQRKGAAWGQGPKLSLDRRGWITRLEPDCWAETPLCTIEGGHYPAGNYTVLYQGTGTLDFGNASVIAQKPGRLVVRPDPARGGFFLRIRATDPSSYVRDIRVIMPGFEKRYGAEPFHPAFLKRWQGVASLRFMDWMQTNDSRVSRWEERPALEDATWTVKGAPLELMVDLSNRLQADPWFCMPHLADDDYVRSFARAVKQRLAPGLKVYVEYSNEVWNGQFQQNRWSGEEGLKLGFAEKHWEAAWRYTAHRSVQMFDLWEKEFGGPQRLVRVLPSQSANPYVSEQVLRFQDASKKADALAIAPYLSCNVSPGGKPSVAEAEGWTVDQALDYLEKTALPQATGWIREQKQVADRHGLRLLAYEGGQHMVGVAGGENNERLTKILQAANAHPRMAEIYAKYYDAWTAAGGGLFCYFSSVSQWSKWGSWGIHQFYDDDPGRSPKFTATMRWARRLGQKVRPE